jgi:hypothetical protein
MLVNGDHDECRPARLLCLTDRGTWFMKEVTDMASRARAPHRPQTPIEMKDLPLEERIRQRAHEIYLRRGGQDGTDMDDWLQAEQELLAALPEKRRPE